MDTEFMALHHVQTMAIAALFATHPRPDELRAAFARMAAAAPANHPGYAALIEELMRAIPPH